MMFSIKQKIVVAIDKPYCNVSLLQEGDKLPVQL